MAKQRLLEMALSKEIKEFVYMPPEKGENLEVVRITLEEKKTFIVPVLFIREILEKV